MIFGIDVSSYQSPNIAWEKVPAQIAIIKASEGDRVLDPDRLINLQHARAAKKTVGVYHFAHAELGDGAAQAQKLFDACGDTMPDLPPMLDLESLGTSSAETLEFVRDFREGCLETFGRAPMLYTGPAFWRSLGAAALAATDLTDCPLVVAQYPRLDGNWAPGESDRPVIIPPWPSWTMWQFSGSATNVPGIPAGIKVDRDVYNGDDVALRALCGLPPQ